MRLGSLLALLALLTAAPALAGPDAEPTVLLDFEKGEPMDGWDFARVGLSELKVEEGATPSGGRALGINGTSRGGHLVHDVPVTDWRPYRAVSFFAKVEADAPIEMRLAAAEATSFRSLLRRFTLEPGNWREVVLALPLFRRDFRRPAGRIDRVGRVLLEWDDGEGRVVIDDLRLLPGDRGNQSWLPTEDEHLALAFPDRRGRAFQSRNFLLLTDVEGLDEAKTLPLLERCEEALVLLRERYKVPGTLPERVPLVLFSSKETYQGFVARIGKRFGANVPPPKHDGFSVLGYASSTWDPAQGVDRPVLVHEAVHGALERLIHVGSDGNWIQEALANAVQVRFHPGSLNLDLGEAFDERDRGEQGFVPFSVLVSTKSPGTKRYAQLLTVAEFLADEHAERLPAFWEALLESWRLPHESGPRALERTLGEPLERIGAAWIAWGLEAYPCR